MLVSDECTSGIWRHQTKITDISINTTYIHKTVIKLLSRKDFASWLRRAFTLPQEARWSLCTSWWRRRHQSNRDAAGWGCPASPGTEHWPPFPPEWGQRLGAAAEDKDKHFIQFSDEYHLVMWHNFKTNCATTWTMCGRQALSAIILLILGKGRIMALSWSLSKEKQLINPTVYISYIK